MSAEAYLDLPGNEDSLAYQYAKNFLDDPEHSESMERSPVEVTAIVYKNLNASTQESEISHLIAESQETRVAWDSLNRIAQDLLREGKPLPPQLAGWVADVLADQLGKKSKKEREKRRPRPVKGAQRMHNRNRRLCILIGQLMCLFDFAATRGWEDPPDSACDLVATAVGLSYKQVERIWNERERDLDCLHFSWDKQRLMEQDFYPH